MKPMAIITMLLLVGCGQQHGAPHSANASTEAGSGSSEGAFAGYVERDKQVLDKAKKIQAELKQQDKKRRQLIKANGG